MNPRCKCKPRAEPDGTRWRTGGEVKGKLANGVGSQYSHAIFEHGVSSITQADAHTSAASSRLNWRPHRFKWTRPFREKKKYGFCDVCNHVPHELYPTWTVGSCACLPLLPTSLPVHPDATTTRSAAVFTSCFVTAAPPVIIFFGQHSRNLYS